MHYYLLICQSQIQVHRLHFNETSIKYLSLITSQVKWKSDGIKLSKNMCQKLHRFFVKVFQDTCNLFKHIVCTLNSTVVEYLTTFIVTSMIIFSGRNGGHTTGTYFISGGFLKFWMTVSLFQGASSPYGFA